MVNEKKNGAHKYDIQIDVDVSFAGGRGTRLDDKTSDHEEKRRQSCVILPREWVPGARHDNIISSTRDQKDMKNGSYMEIGFNKRQLAHGDVHRRVRRWICIRSPIIVKNGQVVEIAEIESPNRILGERADPYAYFK